MLSTVRLNRRVYTRNSASMKLQGADLITGLDTANWSDTRALELVNGANQGGAPLGKAEGEYGCSADWALYADESILFENKLFLLDPIAAATRNLSRVNFQMMFQFREDVRLRTILLVNCSIAGTGSGVSSGGDKTVTTYTVQPEIILYDGAALANLTPSI